MLTSFHRNPLNISAFGEKHRVFLVKLHRITHTSPLKTLSLEQIKWKQGNEKTRVSASLRENKVTLSNEVTREMQIDYLKFGVLFNTFLVKINFTIKKAKRIFDFGRNAIINCEKQYPHERLNVFRDLLSIGFSITLFSVTKMQTVK